MSSFDLFRTLAEYTYDWETWVDADDVPRWVNPAVERITGYSVSECLSFPDYPLALAHPDDRELLARVLGEARKGTSGNDVEFRVVQKNGAVRWVAISFQAVQSSDGASMGYRTSIRDIHDRKRMEQDLHAMRRRAEAAVVARAELLANVSHELRSPAHCIAGFAELLLGSELAPAQRRQVELISEQCTAMLHQVEDLLELAALEAGGVRIARQAFDVRELATRLVEALEPTATTRGLRLSHELGEAPHWVEGDPHRLRQVLRNLLDNALKFTDEGQVRLTVSARADQVAFEVEDTGTGMEESELERLVQPFQQADASAGRKHGGAGLGLAICKRLVSAMGGEFHIHSRRGEGTRVSVRLPLPLAQAPAPASVEAAAALAQGHALIVDDSATARELLADMLARLGWTSAQAGSRAEALSLFAEQHVDVVLLDYQMPDGDGAETALALRRMCAAQGPEPRVPIYLFTANLFVREQLHEARLAVDGIVQKPVSLGTLRDLLRSAGESEASPLDPKVVGDLLSTRARDGQTMFARIVPRVRIALDSAFATLGEALAQGDRQRAARAAHAVAGEAAMVGASELADHARALEQALESDTDARRAEQALNGLHDARARAERALTRALA